MKRNIVTIFILQFSIFNLQFAQVVPAYTPISLENGGGELFTNSINLNTEDLEIDFRENAQLTIYPNQFIWRLELILSEFRSGHLAISNWLIPEGGRLFIFNDLESYTGPYLKTNQTELISGRFMASNLILEYSEPFFVEFQGNFTIAGIKPDYVADSVMRKPGFSIR